MTPEHGPPNYQVIPSGHCDYYIVKVSKMCVLVILLSTCYTQVCDPRTGRPLADIWDVNHWIALRRQER